MGFGFAGGCGFAGLLGLWVCGFAGDGSMSLWLRAARHGGTRGCGFARFVGSGLLGCGFAGFAGDGSVSSWLRATRWDSWLWVCWVCGFAVMVVCG